MIRRVFVVLGQSLVLALALAAPARAEVFKEFKDWSAVCDNIKSCEAMTFAGDTFELAAFFTIRRAAGPGAPVKVVISAMASDDEAGRQPTVWQLLLDGKPLPGFADLNAPSKDGMWRVELVGPRAEAFLAAIRNGDGLLVKGASKTDRSRFSLSGLSASLLWLDDAQGRVGGATALAKPGPTPASAVPPAPRRPIIIAAKPVSQAGLPKTPPAALKANPALAECDLDPKAGNYDLVVARLAPGKLFWGIPCSAGAYNTFYELFVTDEKGGGAKPAIPPYAPGAEDQPTNELMNISFDPAKQMLSNFDKMRGIGDCGAMSDWVWDGTSFLLVTQYMMPDCHGVPPDDWPSLWQAEVK
ncbi:hypothetical protein QO010_000073 [Caulobacter ginsengisoli]|uniref:DUF1176 domain-containing protein n=1 Tax=Caulobacter ginsengisoli TaxID=400775 RepID=A0ABU0IJY6_9CAUL|nr:DUF1176 domain-containing protein [Caulobacter ginsengisoli]MDQ0462325.1 hypothetical protein [Caulobacter ginsengisoli]